MACSPGAWRCSVRMSSSDATEKRRTLRGVARPVSRIGIGTVGWGDAGRGFGEQYRERGLAEALDAALQGGINFVDTAEVYGAKSSAWGQSAEQILGRIAKERRGGVVTDAEPECCGAVPFVGTKVWTIPWTGAFMQGGAGGAPRTTAASLVDALRASVARNEGAPFDLWSIHYPFPTWSQEALTDALTQGVEEGLCLAVGVSNYSAEQMEEAHALLDRRGIPLATNQVKWSVLDRTPETSGLADKARDLDVCLVAHSPLEGGLLQASGDRDVVTLNKLLEFIGVIHGGFSATQVALNYLMCKGALPIPACTSAVRAREYAACLDFSLGPDDVATIDEKLDYMAAQRKG